MDKKKIKSILIIIMLSLIAILGVTYASLSYEKEGATQELVVGDIWMKYTETNGISLVDAFPGDPYSEYFEFSVEGINTTTNKDIWYDIILNEGDVLSGKESNI